MRVSRFTFRVHLPILWALTTVLALTASSQSSNAPTPKAAGQGDSRGGKPSPVGTLVDLNTASGKELDAIYGVGPATVKKIVDHRPYQSVDDLAKAGLTAKEIERIRPMVTVGKASSVVSPATAPAARATAGNASGNTPTTRNQPSGSSSPAAGTTTPPPPGSGMVWVNAETKVFHREGDPWYGKTKRGSYMTEAAATQAGYRAAKKN